jgi:hypothetical protein
MNYGVDYTAAAEDNKAGADKEDPVALLLVSRDVKTAGPECPDGDQQTYGADKKFLAVVILKEKFFC